MDKIEFSISPTVLIAVFVGGCVLLLFYILKLFRIEHEEKTKIEQSSNHSSDKKKEKIKKKTVHQEGRWSNRGGDKQKFNSPWLLTSLKGHTGSVLGIDYSANGKYLATCGEEDPDPDPDKMSTSSGSSSDNNKENQPLLQGAVSPRTKQGLSRRQRKNRKREDGSPESKKQKQLYSTIVKLQTEPLLEKCLRYNLTESNFYALLHNCLLTDQQLFTMGYPGDSMPHYGIFFSCSPYMPRKRQELDVNARDFVPKSIYTAGSSDFSSTSSSDSSDSGSEPELWQPHRPQHIFGEERVCSRCSKGFFVTPFEYLTQERCVHHWGKLLFKTPDCPKQYACCGGRAGSPGCVTSKLHVWSGTKEGLNGPHYGYVHTRPRKSTDGNEGVYAVDCEMCYTVAGLELTKVTVVGMDGKLVYDSYVKPMNEIVDYNTRYSGITQKDLAKPGVKNLRQVQNDLRGFISSKTILIGHGLENDLRALKMIHKFVVDTSVVFPHVRGFPYRKSLKALVQSVLGREIQTGNNGHDSYEDALACMELMIHKVCREFSADWN